MRDEEAQALAVEKEFFRTKLAEILPSHSGEWALVKDQVIHGFFKDSHDAYAAGVAKFGPGEVFLVVPVREDFDAPVHIPALATGLMYAHL